MPAQYPALDDPFMSKTATGSLPHETRSGPGRFNTGEVPPPQTGWRERRQVRAVAQRPDSRGPPPTPLAARAQPGRLISESPFRHPPTRTRRLPSPRAVGVERNGHVERVVRCPGHSQNQLLLSFSRRPLSPTGPAADAVCSAERVSGGKVPAIWAGRTGLLGRPVLPPLPAACALAPRASEMDTECSGERPACVLLVGFCLVTGFTGL